MKVLTTIMQRLNVTEDNRNKLVSGNEVCANIRKACSNNKPWKVENNGV